MGVDLQVIKGLKGLFITKVTKAASVRTWDATKVSFEFAFFFFCGEWVQFPHLSYICEVVYHMFLDEVRTFWIMNGPNRIWINPLFCNQVGLHPPAPYWADDFLVHWPRNSVRVSTVQRKQWRKRRYPWNHIAHTCTHSTFETMKVYGVLVELFQHHSLAFTVAKTQEPREARESKFLICEERPNSVCV